MENERFCPTCQKEFKSAAGRKSHQTMTHYKTQHAELLAKIENDDPLPKAVTKLDTPLPPPTPSKEVIYYCPRAPFQVLTVRADEWKLVQTPTGDRMLPVTGKYVQFENGQFRTEDPEIIDYIDNKYKSPRYPIISNITLNTLKEKHA